MPKTKKRTSSPPTIDATADAGEETSPQNVCLCCQATSIHQDAATLETGVASFPSLDDEGALLGIPSDERMALFRTDPRYRTLEEQLLALGGTMVAFRSEPHIAILLSRGKAFSSAKRILVRGASNGCHTNAARLWMNRAPKVALVTGWALSDDGCWRQHSWGWRAGDGTWVETTLHRGLGYGVELNVEEAVQFTLSNLGEAAFPHLPRLLELYPNLLNVLRAGASGADRGHAPILAANTPALKAG